MYFDVLPNEILVQIFLSLPDISSALSLAAASQRLNGAFNSSKKLAILTSATDVELGPIDDIIQLLTQNASQPAHLKRQVPMSEALLRQCIRVGRTAQRYEEIYPSKKWKHDFANRRLLLPEERFILRRAIYRVWLYTAAFHNSAHVRTRRLLPSVQSERAALLHNYSSPELAEMLDVHAVLKDMIAKNICPSNGKVRQKYQKRYPDNMANGGQQLIFNFHGDYQQNSSYVTSFTAAADTPILPQGTWSNSFPPPFISSPFSQLQSHPSYQTRPVFSRFHEPGAEGWGDDISHYYIVEDMMKLDPAQILFLRDSCPFKSQVDQNVRELGEWFTNNGETFSETVAYVCRQRGSDVQELRDMIEDGELGVVVNDGW